MAERKPISKTTRFEVFKRDKFTCQYCGRSAPEVVLEVDHINPVANGGDNSIENLVTSCFDCNRGKGKRTLSDDAVIAKRKARIDELAERREQIEMMYEWQMSLINGAEKEVEFIESIISAITDYELTDWGKQKVRGLLSRYGFDIVAESTRIAFERYYDDGDSRSWDTAFDKVGGVCYFKTHKTCSQCQHDIGYDGYNHLVECEYMIDGTDWHRNAYAEKCLYFERRYGDYHA